MPDKEGKTKQVRNPQPNLLAPKPGTETYEQIHNHPPTRPSIKQLHPTIDPKALAASIEEAKEESSRQQ